MNLTEWREAEGKTQEQVAALLGVTQSVYSRWENGARRPTLKSAVRIIKMTGGVVTLSDLLATNDAKRQRTTKAKKGGTQ